MKGSTPKPDQELGVMKGMGWFHMIYDDLRFHMISLFCGSGQPKNKGNLQ